MTKFTVSQFGKVGMIKDTAAYVTTPQAFDEVQNVRFNTTGAETFAGEKEVMLPAGFSPTWLRVFPPLDNPIWVYADGARVFAFDGAHNEITRIAGPYTGDPRERWQGNVFQSLGIFNNTFDVPQLWNPVASNIKLIDLPNWPATLRCKSIRPFKNFLIAMHTIEGPNERPYRVRWSDATPPGAYPFSWDIADPTTLAGEVDIAGSEDYVIDGCELGEQFILYKQNSVHGFQYIGLPNVFANYPLIKTKGLLTRDCFQEFSGGHFVAGVDDLYIHTGNQNSEQSILESRLRNWVFNQIDSTNFFNCYTFNYKRKNELYFCFPEAGAQYPTLAVVFNVLTGGVGIRELRQCPFIYPGPVITSQNSTDDIWGDDTQTFHRLTEDGNIRILESGQTRITEDG